MSTGTSSKTCWRNIHNPTHLIKEQNHMKLFRFLQTALVLAGASIHAAEIQVRETPEAIVVTRGTLPLLTYHTAEVPPPEGTDPIFRRSGFIHPLHAPSGGVVTSIHAPDHIHHMGLWHAWVQTKHAGRKIDFWNLKSKLGRVRHSRTISTTARDGSPGFVVELEQVATTPDAPDGLVILRDELEIRIEATNELTRLDYNLRHTNVTDSPLQLPAYRYGGGVAYRAPLSWNKTNSDYLTDLGKRRADSHSTRAHWVAIHGPVEAGTATLLFLGHPENFDAPQRIRTWDDGKVFFNFVPTQGKAWEIAPAQTIELRHRVVLFDGTPDTPVFEAENKRYASGE